MNNTNQSTAAVTASAPKKAVFACALIGFGATAAFAQEVSFDGLVAVEDAAVASAYIDPEADFSVFERVMILDPVVAFRSDWQRDQNRSRTGTNRVSTSDMERIKADVARLFRDVFIERLQADDGYEVVNEGGDDVLLLRPAIIDLDVTAPDIQSAGRTQTYAATAGAATIYIEFFDSVTGDILGRAIDRQVAKRPGNIVQWTSRVTNTQDARRVLGGWADLLRAFLDEHYTE